MAIKTIRSFFLYPPTESFRENADAWWSWPGTDFDAEGRQAKFMEALRGMGQRLDMSVQMDDTSLWTDQHIRAAIGLIESDKPAGVLVVQFYNQSTSQADTLIRAAEELGVPVVYYVGLGVRHGPGQRFRGYRRRGLRFIMAVDNFDAIEESLAMIKTGKTLGLTPPA